MNRWQDLTDMEVNQGISHHFARSSRGVAGLISVLSSYRVSESTVRVLLVSIAPILPDLRSVLMHLLPRLPANF